MSTLAAQVRARQLTADFLSALAAAGHPLGVDDYQRVQELLLRLPDMTSDRILGDSLVALFARDATEQQRLRDLFQETLAHRAAADRPLPEPEEDPELVDRVRRDRWRLILASLFILLPAVLLVILWFTREETYQLADRQLAVPIGTTVAVPDLDSLPEIGRVQDYAWPAPGTPGAPVYGRLDTIGGPLVYEVTAQDTLRDTVQLTLLGTERRVAELQYVFHIRPDTSRLATTAPPSTEIKAPTTTQDLQPLPLPHPRGLADLAPVEVSGTALRDGLHRWWWPLVVGLFLAVLTGLFFLLRYLYRRRIQLVARREAGAGAPHFWRVELPELRAAIDWGDRFDVLLRRLRQRREDSHRELNVADTIQATIDRGGLVDFRYRAATRPAEYLLLIDRGGADNHRARLFEALYQRLHAEEVLIERYFYDGDPRYLYRNGRAETTTLTDLQRRLGDARLILVGDGARLLNAASGRPAKWADAQLKPWAQRSLLTTVPTEAWGRTERQLAALLPVLPASLDGLRLLVERQNDPTDTPAADRPDYRDLVEDAADQPIRLSGSLLGSLERVYPPAQLHWIAACALYPALHWDLTLYLGRELEEIEAKAEAEEAEAETKEATNTSSSGVPPPLGEGARGWVPSPPTKNPGRNLLTSQTLLSLLRLPWFRRGHMPEPARQELAAWLEHNHPALYRHLRTRLLDVLNRVPLPATGSAARRDLDFWQLQNEWLLAAPESPERARLADDLARRIEAGQEPDITLVKYLERPDDREIVLDDKWKKRLYPGGFRGLGWNWAVRRLAMVVLPLLLLFGLGGWWGRPDVQSLESCAEPVLTYADPRPIVIGDTTIADSNAVYSLQLCDKQDSLTLEEYAWAGQIANASSIDQLNVPLAANDFVLLRQADSSAYFHPRRHAILLTLQNQPITDSLDRTHVANISAMLYNRGLELRHRFTMLFLRTYASETSDNVGEEELPNEIDLPDFQLSPNEVTKEDFIRIAGPTLDSTSCAFFTAAAELDTSNRAALNLQLRCAATLAADRELREQILTKIDELARLDAELAALSPPPGGPQGGSAALRRRIADWTRAEQDRLRARTHATSDLNYANELQRRGRTLLATLATTTSDRTEEPGTSEGSVTSIGNDPATVAVPPAGGTTGGPPRPALAPIPAGTFRMGDTFGEGAERELPVHEVTLPAFQLGRYEVTFEEFDLFVDSTGYTYRPADEGWGRGRRPVINVSWYDAVSYANWLSTQHGYTPVYRITDADEQAAWAAADYGLVLNNTRPEITADWSANGYRLPTEAEWEYAAAYVDGTRKARFGNGRDTARYTEMNFDATETYKKPYSVVGEYREQTVPVGSLRSSNSLGLHDMSGNVYEWAWDWVVDYASSSGRSPKGPSTGRDRVIRGGSWRSGPYDSRAADRRILDPTDRAYLVGFRLARS